MVIRAAPTDYSSQRSPKMWSHCFVGLKGHQQEEEDTSEATMFALMLTPEAKWWPSCLRSVSVCEKVIKIIIICYCREEAWTTCARRGSSAGEKLGGFDWVPVEVPPKGIQDSSEGGWERLLTVLTSTQIPFKSLNITFIKPCAAAYTNSYWSYHNACTCLVLSGEGLPYSVLPISTRVCPPICRFCFKDWLG